MTHPHKARKGANPDRLGGLPIQIRWADLLALSSDEKRPQHPRHPRYLFDNEISSPEYPQELFKVSLPGSNSFQAPPPAGEWFESWSSVYKRSTRTFLLPFPLCATTSRDLQRRRRRRNRQSSLLTMIEEPAPPTFTYN